MADTFLMAAAEHVLLREVSSLSRHPNSAVACLRIHGDHEDAVAGGLPENAGAVPARRS
jgi:hypothetical protein